MSTHEPMTTVDLLRHGRCDDGEIYRGTTDSQLSSIGKRQMLEAVGEFRGWTSVVTSPMTRCADVAGELAKAAKVSLFVDKAFREVHFGEWEGRSVEQVWREEPERVAAFYRDPGAVTPPGGESMLAAQRRAVLGWQQLLQRGRGGHHLLISHGGTIRLLLAEILELPLSAIARLDISYASLAQVRIYHADDNDHPVLVSLRPGTDPA